MSSPVNPLNAALQGRYLVERQIGEGGMATVYLATDVRHDRRVALKVLKPELAAVVGADRFLAEIRTTANLQHPHILPLFDSGQADGMLFYVMPYVEGESLRERLDREHQLPVDEAVRIATNVAEALDYAHARGVIHRDIKPANILLQSGKPVVSDFGIALAVNAGSAGRLTETGLSLGTPHYMSPEQATGDENVSAATDIWALGCVLYEMLVGEPPYVGSTPQAILGKIIQADPASASAERRSVPPHLDATIRKALEKLPADRFSGAQAFARALGDPGFRHGEAAATSHAASNAWRLRELAGWALAATAVSVLVFDLVRPEPPEPVERFALAYEPLVIPVLMPDGSGVVIGTSTADGRTQLALRTWDDLVPRPIPGTEGVQPTVGSISPDGREIAFTAGGQLRVVALAGGGGRTLTEGSSCCAWWASDGYVYFSDEGERNILRVRAVGGPVEQVTAPEVQRAHSHYRPVPDEDLALFEETAGTGTDARIMAVRLSTGEVREIAPGLRPFLTSTRHLVWVTEQGALMAAPFDFGRMDLSGEPVAMLEAGSVGRIGAYSLSASGTLAYVQAPAPSYELVWVDRAGAATPVDAGWAFDPGDGSAGWSLAPDGTRIALREQTGEGSGIWVKDLRTGSRTRLTFEDVLHRKPRWAPDGRTVTYLAGRDADLNVWSRRADGGGEAALVFDHPLGLNEGFYSPDGEWLIIRIGSGGDPGMRDILTVRQGVDTTATPLMATRQFAEQSPAISPDGRWIAYASDETGRLEIYVRPFPDVDGEKVSVSRSSGGNPVWSRDGRELFFVADGPRQLMVARVSTRTGFAVDGVETVFDVTPDYYFSRLSDFYDVSPDGERFLFARRVEGGAATAPQLILVRNWLQELVERVPIPG